MLLGPRSLPRQLPSSERDLPTSSYCAHNRRDKEVTAPLLLPRSPLPPTAVSPCEASTMHHRIWRRHCHAQAATSHNRLCICSVCQTTLSRFTPGWPRVASSLSLLWTWVADRSEPRYVGIPLPSTIHYLVRDIPWVNLPQVISTPPSASKLADSHRFVYRYP